MTTNPRVQVNYDRARNADRTQLWVETIGAKFVDVQMFKAGEDIGSERHVDDVTTIHETVEMTVSRLGCTAVYPYMGRWSLKAPGKPVRYYDTEDAAVMVALHGR